MKTLLFMLFILCACAPLEALEHVPTPPPEESPKINSHQPILESHPLSVEIRGLETPQRYQATLRWDSPLSMHDPIEIVRLQIHEKNTQRTVFTVERTANSFVDNSLHANQMYQYLIREQRIEVRTGHDLLIDGIRVLDPALKAELQAHGLFRVFFLPNSMLLTQGEPLEINVPELYTSHAQIRAFQEQAHAPDHTPGRPSGNVSLRAQRATGHLHIDLQGEGGGLGTPGASGPSGKRGGFGELGMIARKNPISDYCRSVPNYYECFVCLRKSAPAPKGGSGGPGENGGKGAPGGNGGSVHLTISDATNFKPTFSVAGGKGGPGGRGGPGGEGGPEGVFSELIPTPPDCQTHPRSLGAGDRGPDGQQGPAGSSGSNGRVVWNAP